MGQKRSLFAVVGGSQSHVPFIQAAKDLGYRTVIFDRNPSAPGAAIADTFYPISTHDVEGIVTQCCRLHKKQPLAGIVTYSAYTMPLRAVARVAETLGLRAFSLKTVESVTNKVLMKRALSEAQVPMPQWVKTNDCTDATAFLANCQSPIVIKPSVGTMGSIGVSMVTEEHAIHTAFEAAAQASQDGSVIVERFHKGREFSVGGIADATKATVLAVAEKFSLGPTQHFTISGFAMGRISEDDEQWRGNADSIAQIALGAVRALNIRNSFFTVDLLLANEGPLVLEVGILLDAKIDRLLSFSGINVYDMICRVAAGQDIEYEKRKDDRGYALKFMFANRHGRRKANRRPELRAPVARWRRYQVEWERMDGDLVQSPRSIADTLGWVVVEHDDAWSSFQEAVNISQQKYFDIVQDDVR